MHIPIKEIKDEKNIINLSIKFISLSILDLDVFFLIPKNKNKYMKLLKTEIRFINIFNEKFIIEVIKHTDINDITICFEKLKTQFSAS